MGGPQQYMCTKLLEEWIWRNADVKFTMSSFIYRRLLRCFMPFVHPWSFLVAVMGCFEIQILKSSLSFSDWVLIHVPVGMYPGKPTAHVLSFFWNFSLAPKQFLSRVFTTLVHLRNFVFFLFCHIDTWVLFHCFTPCFPSRYPKDGTGFTCLFSPLKQGKQPINQGKHMCGMELVNGQRLCPSLSLFHKMKLRRNFSSTSTSLLLEWLDTYVNMSLNKWLLLCLSILFHKDFTEWLPTIFFSL